VVKPLARQSEAGGSGGSVGLFPAGKRQARVQLPALMLTVTPEDVLGSGKQGGSLEDIGAAVAAGATAVVLAAGGGGAGGGGELYEAAVRLKDLLRGRAALLVSDRTDIVDAAGADGALLTAAGLPTVVAKRMLQDGLALVGRSVAAAEAAAEAAADGANFVVLEPSNSGAAAPNAAEAVAAQQQQRSSASIPVVAAVGGAASREQLAGLLSAGVDGLAVPLAALRSVAAALAGELPVDAGAAAAAVLQRLAGGGAEASTDSAGPGAVAAAQATAPERAAAQLTQLLSSSREELVDAERRLLSEVRAAAQGPRVCMGVGGRGCSHSCAAVCSRLAAGPPALGLGSAAQPAVPGIPC
jgi:thiamine monophosphate synthase